MTRITALACACGQVQLEAERAPIISTECHCNSCRTAGAKLEAARAARPVLEANGGTRFVLYRKDRIRLVRGAELLKEFRLTPKSPTRRVVAGCCITPLFLEFENGHWLSLYSGLWPRGTQPSLDLRTMTSGLPHRAALADDVPSGKRQTALFYAKLLRAWIAMGFKSPKISVGGTLQESGTQPKG